MCLDHHVSRGSFVRTEVLDRHFQKLDHHEAYLCGSPGMIDASIKVFKAKGLPDELIFYDKFA